MAESEKDPHGYIYLATNKINAKQYIGQTVTDRWPKNSIPIRERWNEECSESYRRFNRGAQLRYIEYAIIKYGPENFDLEEQDTAKNQEELDEKETHYIKEYDLMDPDKGYNLNEGGSGGRFSELAKQNLSNSISDKWEFDEEYREKQNIERKERCQDGKWIQNMTEINQERAKEPEYQENMSKTIKEKWQEEKYSNTVRERVSDKWQNAEYIDRQLRARAEGGKKIPDKEQFLKDIQEMNKKEINEKYGMNGKTTNRKIHKMLGEQGVKNYSQAREYLKDKNLNDVMKDIEKNELQRERSSNRGVKKMIDNKKEFLRDIQTMKKKEINQKYNMDGRTTSKRIGEMLGHQRVYNYSQAREYLKNKDLSKVVKNINRNEKIERARKLERGTNIDNKEEFMKAIKNLSKKEINRKYQMDGKTINNKIEQMLGHQGVKNYSQAREYLQDKEFKDVLKDIEKQESNDNDEK